MSWRSRGRRAERGGPVASIVLSPVVERWASQLAADVAPDEVELAPVLTGAFVAGGAARAELFRVDSSVPGGFGGGGLTAVLPVVLAGLCSAAPIFWTVVTGGPTALKDALEVWDRLHPRDAAAPAPPAPSPAPDPEVIDVRDPAGAPGDPDAAAPAAPSAPAASSVLAGLGRVSVIVESELERAGFPAEQRQAVTLGVVRRLLIDPEGTGEFLHAVAPR